MKMDLEIFPLQGCPVLLCGWVTNRGPASFADPSGTFRPPMQLCSALDNVAKQLAARSGDDVCLSEKLKFDRAKFTTDNWYRGLRGDWVNDTSCCTTSVQILRSNGAKSRERIYQPPPSGWRCVGFILKSCLGRVRENATGRRVRKNAIPIVARLLESEFDIKEHGFRRPRLMVLDLQKSSQPVEPRTVCDATKPAKSWMAETLDELETHGDVEVRLICVRNRSKSEAR